MAYRVASLLNTTALVAPQGDTLAAWRSPRERDRAHLECVSKLPCIICAYWPVEVAHIRYGDLETGKPHAGMGEKPSDYWTAPLCAKHHRQAKDSQHASNERAWWAEREIDPLTLARDLYACSGDLVSMLDIINSTRPECLQDLITLDPLVAL